MEKERKLNIKIKVYIYSVIIAACFLAIFFGRYQNINISDLIFWSCVGIVAESLMIALSSGIGVSVGFAVTVASIIVIGPYQAAICGAISIALRIIDVSKKNTKHIFNTEFYKTAFNASQVFISTLLVGFFYISVGGNIKKVTWPQVLGIIPVYVIINCFFLGILMYLLMNSKISSWICTLANVAMNCALVGFIGIIMALVSIKIDNYAVLLFFGPLLIARYSYKQYMDMKEMYMETIDALNKAMEAKDPYTSGHALRVQQYSEKIGTAMGLPLKSIQNIRTAAILHDIGKIGIDDFILRKPDKLTLEEFQMIKRHPEIGADILKEIDFLSDAARIIRSHHERYDGKGYPDGKKMDEIPIEASILAIADVYDAMTSDRPYRSALSKEEALEEIKRNAGIQFCPKVAEAFCEIMSENKGII